MNFSQKYLSECIKICNKINPDEIEEMASLIHSVRKNNGRIFFLGVGGGAGHASHAVNDFRKICNIECYSPTDNVSELTARVNDDGWDSSYVNWLKGSHLSKEDLIFVFSVGGGSIEKNISVNILNSLKLAKKIGSKICGVVGRDGGFTKEVANCCIVIPTVNDANITPHTEAFQAVIWHLLVAHPLLLTNEMKWESVK
tara:strand:- start:1551 stop:2147 length:597 start_codon:yes stop_codon:yes gene_type:complete